MCIVENCINDNYVRGYCTKHYRQIITYGEIMESKKQRKFVPSEIIINQDFAELIIRNRQREIIGISLIDLDDLEKVSKYRWFLTGAGYAWHKGTNERHALHRYITDCPKNMVVDHKNHNTLDNRKSNLRICTRQENQRNMMVRKDSASKTKGVRLHPKWGWQSYIHNKGKQLHIGWFKTKEEAIKARNLAANSFYGEFSNE